MKNLKIVDEYNGEVLEDFHFEGGYNIAYADEKGYMRYISELDNGRFGESHWIKNSFYRPIAQKLKAKFKDIYVDPVGILFIEDMEWKKPNSERPKAHWMARISKANKQFEAMTGYVYILETRHYFIEKMTHEQIIALIYHEMRHVDQYGSLKSHDVEDWNNMIATLGVDWATTKADIANILEDDIDWKQLEPVAEQTSMFEKGNIRVIK